MNGVANGFVVVFCSVIRIFRYIIRIRRWSLMLLLVSESSFFLLSFADGEGVCADFFLGVVDTCRGCSMYDIDVSPSLFKKIAPGGDGRVKGIDWGGPAVGG